jgi:hypothetical protein
MQYGTCFARYLSMMKKVFIRQNSWLARLVAKRLGFLRVAVVIGRNIYLHNATVQEFMKNKRWLLHELKHVEQYEIGLLRFFKEYFREYRKNGYDNNRFEIEARQAESDTKLLEKYDLSLYMML